MKAITYTKYGPPEVLQVSEVETPSPRDNEVLIRIHASTVTAVDCTFRAGKPFIGRFFNGLTGPKNPIPGTEFAGVIEEVGNAVTRFTVGDRVFGTTLGVGVHAEYLCLVEDKSTLAVMPNNLSFEEAVACDGFLTALPFLRDAGDIKGSKKVLVYGASGSVGSSAVQLARFFGAEVTGVCSTANMELVRSLGADQVIDYKTTDYTTTGETWDIIFDTVGKTSFPRAKQVLSDNGIFLETSISSAIIRHMLWSSKVGSKKAKIIFTGLRSPEERTEDLIFIRELMEAGTIRPVVDRTWPLEEIVEAHRYVETGHKKGNVVITVCADNIP